MAETAEGTRRPRGGSAWLGPLGLIASLGGSEVGFFFLCLFLTGISYALFFLLGAMNRDNYVYIVFCDRGWIPYACTFLFYMAIVLQVRKYHRALVESGAFDLEKDLFPAGMEGAIRKETADAIGAKIRMLPEASRDLLLCRRLDKSLQRLRNTGSSGEMSSILNDLSAIDRNNAESGYTSIKFLLAVIPILGFIGTVLGISMAIAGFAIAISESQDFAALKPRLRETTYHLGVAFETTLVALVFSALIMALNAILQKREDDLLTQIDDYCITNILNRLRVGDEGARSAELLGREIEAFKMASLERSRELEDAIREVAGELGVWIRRGAGLERAPAKPPSLKGGPEPEARRP